MAGGDRILAGAGQAGIARGVTGGPCPPVMTGTWLPPRPRCRSGAHVHLDPGTVPLTMSAAPLLIGCEDRLAFNALRALPGNDWIMMDGRPYFVAGYTPGGAPYGIYLDEMDEGCMTRTITPARPGRLFDLDLSGP